MFQGNVCCVDVSYLTFYRFFALRKWYSFAHKDDLDSKEKDYKWLNNKLFIEKYKKTLLLTILKICKKNKIPLNNIVFAYDCRRKDIWRKNLKTKQGELYKATRSDSHKNQNFTEFEIFNLVKNEFLKEFVTQNNNTILQHPNLEADDCIALFINKHKDTVDNIIIIASDHDYLQICDEKVHLVDLKEKLLDQIHLVDKNIDKHILLLEKILCGDVSDNIGCCYLDEKYVTELKTKNINVRKNKGEYRITKSIFNKIIDNDELKELFLKVIKNKKDIESEKVKINKIVKNNMFFDNQIIIDFDFIPKKA
jgi:hypothetical protein